MSDQNLSDQGDPAEKTEPLSTDQEHSLEEDLSDAGSGDPERVNGEEPFDQSSAEADRQCEGAAGYDGQGGWQDQQFQQFQQGAGPWQNQSGPQYQQHQQWQGYTQGPGFQQQPPPPWPQPPYPHPPGSGYESYGNYNVQEVPPEIRKWNWGAFMFTWIWGVGTRTWISLLALIPCFNFVFVFILGAKANEWAWKTGEYRDLETFKRVQESWNRAGFVYFWITLGLSILAAIWMIVFFSFIYEKGFHEQEFSQYF